MGTQLLESLGAGQWKLLKFDIYGAMDLDRLVARLNEVAEGHEH